MAEYIVSWRNKPTNKGGVVIVNQREYEVFNGDISQENREKAYARYNEKKQSKDVVSVVLSKIIESHVNK